MLQKLFALIDLVKPFPVVHAHCDIPCGIYNPQDALQAAKTVLKMVQKMLPLAEEKDTTDHNNYIRMVMNKEAHAEKCKHELAVLWMDYFKEEHLEKVPELHETIWKAAKLCSYNKQHVDEAKAKELVEACEKVAALFEKVEGAPKKE